MPARPATLLLLLATSSCASPPPKTVGETGWGPSLRPGMHGPGGPTPPEPANRPRVLPEEERRRWARADELAGLVQVGGRGPSEHLDRAFERTTWISEGAEDYRLLTTAAIIQPAAIIVQHHHRPGEEAVVASYVMEKPSEGTGWRFWVLDPNGRVAAGDEGGLCARCHREAPYAGLFGPHHDKPSPAMQ